MYYKLTILFFFLTAFSSQRLTDSYQITFDNENATYTLKIDNSSLVFANDQPNTTVIAIGDDSPDTDKAVNNYGKIYKVTKGATFEEGLKVGEDEEIAIDKIGGDEEIAIDKIGEDEEIAIDKIGEDEEIAIDREMNTLLFGINNHQAYEVVLNYELVTVIEKSSNTKTEFPINDGIYLNISGDKFALLR